MEIPTGLAWWRQRADGAAWLDRLPRLVAECAETWDLRVGRPYAGSNVSFVAPADGADGMPAVLKVYVPDVWENEREGDALAHWDGRGAVRLLAHDRDRRALLLERCEPGTPLWRVAEDEADAIALGVLRRLWRPPPAGHRFRSLAEDAETWAGTLAAAWEQLGRPFERRLVDEAVSAVRELAPTQGDAVVLHQDFHSGNVLRAAREPWLAIDPQPLAGEREFDAASLLRDRAAGLLTEPGPAPRLKRRLDAIASGLALDRDRVRGWGLVHALAWGVSAAAGKVEDEMVACARLLAEI